jgi:TrmH RNA methyltransferase
MLIGDPTRQLLTGASVRVAEGGAEHVPVVHLPTLDDALLQFRKSGITVIGADGQAKTPLTELKMPARCAVVLGNEGQGLSPAVRKLCDMGVSIKGSGAIESLNISVAAGILTASYAAQHVVRAG